MRKPKPVVTSLLAAMLSMGLLLVAAGPAAAATCSVPSAAYPTIQSAVSDPTCDTIEVAAGFYAESVTISRPLTLLGPNAGTSWDGSRGAEATVGSPAFPFITFFVSPGDGVEIDGFTINGDFGIYLQGSSDGTLIENNIITGLIRALTLDGTLVTPASSNASVLDNQLISNVRSFHVDGPYTDMAISGNQFSGPAAVSGIFFTGGTPPNSIDGFVFTDNEVLHRANMASNISNATVSGNTFDVVLAGNEILLISLENSTVTENTFEGDDANACLLLWGSQFGLVASDGVTISENIFNNCGTADPDNNFAIRLSPDVRDIDITNNQISNGVEGVNTDDAFGQWDVTDEIHINFNNITDNASFGVRNGQLGVLDAECNWWGAANGPGPVGPGSGDNVSPNVDYTPWLTDEAPGGACFGGLPSGRVNGGGQINVLGGKGSFGFNARSENGAASGHLTYNSHASGAHLNCTVTVVAILSPTQAHLEGTCDSKSSAPSFTAEVEDNGEPGKNVDQFVITYGPTEGGPLRAGNIQIRSEPAAAPAGAQGTDTAVTGAGEGALPSGATFSGISLSGLEVGTGVSIASDGAAAGQFVAVLLGTSLLGQPQEIAIDGKVGGGSIGPDGSATFSGSATVNLGDGSVPLLDVPFTVTATTGGVLVKLNTSTLPSATLTGGSITIE